MAVKILVIWLGRLFYAASTGKRLPQLQRYIFSRTLRMSNCQEMFLRAHGRWVPLPKDQGNVLLEEGNPCPLLVEIEPATSNIWDERLTPIARSPVLMTL